MTESPPQGWGAGVQSLRVFTLSAPAHPSLVSVATQVEPENPMNQLPRALEKDSGVRPPGWLTSPTTSSLRLHQGQKDEQRGVPHLPTRRLLSWGPSFLHGREGTGLASGSRVAVGGGVGVGPGVPGQLRRKTSSAFTARPLGELLRARPRARTHSRQFAPTAAWSRLGKHSGDLWSRLLAPSSQPFTHSPS
ncbi:hypothetical protein HJG60_011101 [Phyllostomus discolor]|uniref:Uncharacterized protein n=1 Tax=Phyllostomus discolor TaxID=89673 RepID=A0A833ZW24_9CHIR|nr:hypothetical protein HJG60_011101 [Phyllostomus discolor]